MVTTESTKAEKDTRIATIPVGYADGIPRLLVIKRICRHSKPKVSIVLGNICMDMLMVDLQNIKAKEGDEVIIFNLILLWKNFLDIAKPFLI